MLFVLLITIKPFTNAQYYYKDIISNKQITADLNAYKENKIRKISVKSFEDNGIESEGFFCEKKISKNYKKSGHSHSGKRRCMRTSSVKLFRRSNNC